MPAAAVARQRLVVVVVVVILSALVKLNMNEVGNRCKAKVRFLFVVSLGQVIQKYRLSPLCSQVFQVFCGPVDLYITSKLNLLPVWVQNGDGRFFLSDYYIFELVAFRLNV